MKEFTLKINRPPVGYKVAESRSMRGDRSGRRGGQDGKGPFSAEMQKIKTLNDRIKILEMELQKAREDSFRAGYEEGRQSIMGEAQKRIEAMNIEMQAMEIKYLEAIEKIEGPLLAISKRMAEEIISIALKLPEAAEQSLYERLRKMLYEIIDQNKVIVEINPELLKNFDSEQIKDTMGMPPKMELNFIGREDLQKGEVIINSEDYYIDGRFKSQIEDIHDQLANEED